MRMAISAVSVKWQILLHYRNYFVLLHATTHISCFVTVSSVFACSGAVIYRHCCFMRSLLILALMSDTANINQNPFPQEPVGG